MKVISYYTSKYANQASKLAARLEHLGLNFLIMPVEDQGSWIKNCLYKPKFILDEFKEDILYLDVDTDIKQFPYTIFKDDFDIAVVKSNVKLVPFKSSVIFFKYNDKVLKFLQEWRKYSYRVSERKFPNIVDDHIFSQLISKSELKIKILNEKYAYVPNESPHYDDLYFTIGISKGESKEKFYANWFPPSFNYEQIKGFFHKPTKEFYDWITNNMPIGSTFVEVGLYQGKSLCYLLHRLWNLRKYWNVYGVDTWGGIIPSLPSGRELKNIFLENMKKAKVEDHFILDEENEPAKYIQDAFDCVYVDGAHDYESVVKDIMGWLPRIKKGGIFAGDDYTDQWPGVIKAVDELLPQKEIRGTTWVYYA